MSRPFDPNRLAQAHLSALEPYTPGEQPTGVGWIKLNTNESPYDPSPMVARAVQAEAEKLRLYPHPVSRPLREAIAREHELQPSEVIVGNGSDDVLNLIFRVFGDPTQPSMAAAVPCYSLYGVLAAIQNSGLKAIPFDREMRLDVPRIVSEAESARVLFVTSPNAPTGVAHPLKEIRSLLEAFPGIVVVDEAYAAFAEEDAIPLLKEYENLIVTRTFSKSHGLAGLRVGYGLSTPETIRLLDKVRDSYNVNRLSQAGALAALQDAHYTFAIVGKIKRIRNYTTDRLEARGWFVYPSQANFVFAEPLDGTGAKGAEVAASLFEFLRERKILVRIFPSHPLTAGFLRISIGTEDQMEHLEEAIDLWQQQTA